MSFKQTGFLAAVLAVLVFAGCSLLSPGYSEREAALNAKLQTSEQARVVAEQEAQTAQAKALIAKQAVADAMKTGDPASISVASAAAVAAMESLAKSQAAHGDAILAEMKANRDVMQNQLTSATEAAKNAAGLTPGQIGTYAVAGIAAVMGYLGKRQSDQNTVAVAKTNVEVAAVTSGPSRAAPDIEKQWDDLAALRAELEHVKGRIGLPLAPIPGAPLASAAS